MAHRLVKIQPPSGAIAGMMTTLDTTEGIWKAPANVSLVSIWDVTLTISHQAQEFLNLDSISGKSICAIRNFPGKGPLVWGARTLDGNNNDWRYINVVRTLTMIEQSCKLALEAFVFEPNDSNTWLRIKNMFSRYLEGLWRQGGIVGTTPDDGIFVLIGLNQSMTQADLDSGRLRCQIGVAISRPAEFTVITLEQKMETIP